MMSSEALAQIVVQQEGFSSKQAQEKYEQGNEEKYGS
jgi:hypothetical protein